MSLRNAIVFNIYRLITKLNINSNKQFECGVKFIINDCYKIVESCCFIASWSVAAFFKALDICNCSLLKSATVNGLTKGNLVVLSECEKSS